MKELLVIQMVIEGPGSLDIRALSRAVHVASAVCPGTRLLRRGRMWVDGGRPPRLLAVDGSRFDRTALAGVPELCGPLAESSDSASCEVLLLTGDPSTVVFRAAHAVMDGKGMLTWVTEVFRALRDETLCPAADPLTDSMVLDATGRVGQRPRLRLDQHSPLGGEAGGRTIWRRRTIPGRHSAVVAKVAAAIADSTPGPSARIMVPVDLRRHAPSASSTANLALPVFLDAVRGEGPETLHRRLLNALSDRRELVGGPETALAQLPLATATAAMRASRAAARTRHRYLASAIVSHVGRQDLEAFSTSGFTATAAYLLPVHAPLVPFSVTTLEQADRIELVVSARGSADVGERCAALLDRIESALLTSAARPLVRVVSDTERLLEPGAGGLPSLQTTVVERFREQAARTPDAIAVTGGDRHWTYGELDRRSDVIAGHLIASGVSRGELVVLLADRSAMGVAGVWGVLKAGAAFLPMDIGNPSQRIREVVRDAGVRFCLAETGSAAALTAETGSATLLLDDLVTGDSPVAEAVLDAASPTPNDLAYVIYTSGSTGKPKGVQIEHVSLTNAVGWLAAFLRCDTETRMAYSASPSFDMSIAQIFPALLHGGSVVPLRGELDHAKLREMFSGRTVNTLVLTPSHIGLAERLGIRPSGIRAVQVGGENLDMTTAQRVRDAFGPECLISNGYGPTEATVACTVAVVDERSASRGSVIGVPAHRTEVSVLDGLQREVDDGEVGELYVSGVQVARGYLGRPDLTAERFTYLADGRRAYRTGDLVRRMKDGNLQYVGREDCQVKIRGHRVEPSEVEAAAARIPGVTQAAVVARSQADGSMALCAFVVPERATQLDASFVLAALRSSLPSHLVPAKVVVVASLPQTSSGKTDRNALTNPFCQPQTETTGQSATPVLAGPADRSESDCGDDENVIAEVWATILTCDADDLDPSSDFHAVGGDSLAMLEMLEIISDKIIGRALEQDFLDCLAPLSQNLTLGRVADAVRAVRRKT
ncbi:amino acid adenylation domain-containing protein [Streptomyces sp. NPDC057686]|uniref:amino acid adenylation domain-containing protein n=1 Tax=Streptomyces sp. NPDC057686 TaxID=3346212 RepID=UPI00367AA7D8